MDRLSYVKDSSQAVDQVKRLKIWTKLGYAVIDPKKFQYVQPPLEDGGSPCDVLSLNSYIRKIDTSSDGLFRLGEVTSPSEVKPQTLYNHLRAFFLQSVCKDKDADKTDPTTVKALAQLKGMIDRGETIPTVPSNQRQEYLATWAARVGALQQILRRSRLSGQQTIEDMYLQRQAKIDAMIANQQKMAGNDNVQPNEPGFLQRKAPVANLKNG